MVKRRRRSKKWISWFLIFVLLIVAVVVCYLVWDNYFNDNKKQDTSETAQVEVGEEEITTEDDGVSEKTDEDEKKVKQYEGEDPNKKENLSGSVTYAGLLNDNIAIRVNIDQFLEEGNCELNVATNDEIIYRENVRVISSASTATCEGFDFYSPAIASGTYNIIVRVTSGEREGLISGVLEI